jgi:hypothetical protein
VIEGETEGDDGRHNEDNESRILHSLPGQAQETLRRLGWDHIGAKDLFPPVKVIHGYSCPPNNVLFCILFNEYKRYQTINISRSVYILYIEEAKTQHMLHIKFHRHNALN